MTTRIPGFSQVLSSQSAEYALQTLHRLAVDAENVYPSQLSTVVVLQVSHARLR